MADQPQTKTNTQSEPILCKHGCGFFGNTATGGCCSTCWRKIQKTKTAVAEAQIVAPSSPSAGGLGSIVEEEVLSATSKGEQTKSNKVVLAKQELDALYKESLLLDGTLMPGGDDDDDDAGEIIATTTPKSSTTSTETPIATSSSVANVPAAPQLKKKKKKKSYKNMMASMMLQQSPSKDDDKDEAAIRKVTGGGVFSKIDKIWSFLIYRPDPPINQYPILQIKYNTIYTLRKEDDSIRVSLEEDVKYISIVW